MEADHRSRRVAEGTNRSRALTGAVSVLVASAGLILSGCGGSSDPKPERSANVKPSYDTSCPEKRGTGTVRGSLFNAVPGSYSLKFSVPQGSYDCADWSGTSTPGGAFDGKSISRGFPEPFRLEHNNRPFSTPRRYWTMNVAVWPRRLGSASDRFDLWILDVWPARAISNFGALLPKTNWGGPPVRYLSTTDDREWSVDSDPELVKDACSKDPKAFGLGVYKGRLSWLFCYQPEGGPTPG